MFADLNSAEWKRALRDGPVHAWNAIELRNEDGQAIGAGDASRPPSLVVKSASILTLPTVQATVQSVVVLDDDAVLGKSLTQLADYVAMRTLAGARPPKSGADAGTILTLFDPGAIAAPELTSLDRSFLRELYRGNENSRAIAQKSQISNRIVRDSRERSGEDKKRH